jgi:hypothetical protein
LVAVSLGEPDQRADAAERLAVAAGSLPPEPELPSLRLTLPVVGGPLAGIVPFDPDTLRLGLEAFLRRFEDLASAFATPSGRLSPWPWVAGFAVAAAAWGVRRSRNRLREHVNPFRDDSPDEPSWPVGWPEPSFEDRT